MVSEQIREKPNLSVLALISFVASFIVTRAFTTFYPNVVLVGGDYHIHHFWYGIAMLAIGGWTGISYESERTNRLAAITFGAGGGIISDEIGLLLTLKDYWAGITYVAVSLILVVSSMLIFLRKYRNVMLKEFAQFTGSNASLYFGVFTGAVSVAFILETDDIRIITVSSGFALMALVFILTHLVQHIMIRRRRGEPA